MMNNIFDGISQRSHYLFEKWKYLLLQEKCRLCQRMIHPLIEKMNFEHYAPSAKYFIDDKEIISDALCQFCLPQLASCQAFLNQHQVEYSGDSQYGAQELLVASAAVFKEPVNSLILSLKYSNDVLLAKDLAILLLRAWALLKSKVEDDENDHSICFVPVPLHRRRLQERGFNQSELLAQHLSKLLKLPIETKLLCRIKDTLSQQELSKVERRINVSAAFKAIHKDAFVNRQVILVDDVCTSGATLKECAAAVVESGAVAVYALSVAFVP